MGVAFDSFGCFCDENKIMIKEFVCTF